MEDKSYFDNIILVTLRKDAGLTKDDVATIKQFAEQLGCNKMAVGYFKQAESAMVDDKTITFEAPIEHWDFTTPPK